MHRVKRCVLAFKRAYYRLLKYTTRNTLPSLKYVSEYTNTGFKIPETILDYTTVYSVDSVYPAESTQEYAIFRERSLLHLQAIHGLTLLNRQLSDALDPAARRHIQRRLRQPSHKISTPKSKHAIQSKRTVWKRYLKQATNAFTVMLAAYGFYERRQ